MLTDLQEFSLALSAIHFL